MVEVGEEEFTIFEVNMVTHRARLPWDIRRAIRDIKTSLFVFSIVVLHGSFLCYSGEPV